MQECPTINKRIREVAEHYTNGIISRFAEAIKVKQQTLNRLFIIDKRTGKYPTATTEILQAISEMYDNLNTRWLLIGAGEMFVEDAKVEPNVGVANSVASTKDGTLIKELGRLEGKIEILERELAQNRKEKDRLVSIIEGTLTNN